MGLNKRNMFTNNSDRIHQSVTMKFAPNVFCERWVFQSRKRKRRRVKKICAWCNKVLIPGPLSAAVSTGICAECEARIREEQGLPPAEEEIEDQNSNIAGLQHSGTPTTSIQHREPEIQHRKAEIKTR